MNYLYKLLDETTQRELVEHNRISLSRPFFEFKSEGKGISIFRNIKDLIDNASNPDEITPTKKILSKVKVWIDDYYHSLPDDIRKNYSYDYDIDDDLLIAMTIYCQSYCGYFTKVNLQNKETREEYLLQNKRLSFNKSAYVKIPVESNMLDQLFWISRNDDYTFNYSNDQSDNIFVDGIKASLHIHKVEHAPTGELTNPFVAFNGKDNRCISSLLKYLNEDYRHQDEERIVLRIPSYKPMESTTGFFNLYNTKQYHSVEEHVFYILASTYRQAKNYPRFIYLRINDYECYEINHQ